jgi:hypothetical protein
MSDFSDWDAWGPVGPPQTAGPRLQPQGIAEIIGTGWRILKRHWAPLIAAAAIFGVVPLIVNAIVSTEWTRQLEATYQLNDFGRPTRTPSQAELLQFGWASLAVLGTILLSGAFLTLASVAAALYVDRDFRSSPLAFPAALRHVLTRAFAAIGAWLLSTLTTLFIVVAVIVLCVLALGLAPSPSGGAGGIGAFLALVVIVGGVVAVAAVGVRVCVSTVVAALEPVGPISSVARSWHLTGGNAWRTFGVVAVVSLVVGVFIVILTTVVDLVVGVARGSGPTLVSTVLDIVLSIVSAPIVPVMLAVLYYDLRVRRDHLVLALQPSLDRPS